MEKDKLAQLPDHCRMQRDLCDVRFNTIDSRFDNVDKSFEKIETQLTQICECLNGNGKPGLKTQVDRLENNQSIVIKVLGLVASILATVTAYALSHVLGFTK